MMGTSKKKYCMKEKWNLILEKEGHTEIFSKTYMDGI
jgi:hypothetical protein